MNDDPQRELALFTEALEIPVRERAAFLNQACAGNENLRRKVEVLVKIHERTGDFLEQSPVGLAIESIHRNPVGEKPGDQIGRYKLLQQIGEGGCGVVFMAEQQEPVRRRVAVKILKPGMDTRSVIARFEAERQALALMDHPNIAKIFDAGATESCRPYFVMELIRGVKITEYCDHHSLTTEGRLNLFNQVCQAVQHAHQKGVIHRDIKPSNIMVSTTLEGAALPVVIDFGIAKATTNQRLTDKTLFTAFEMLVGTPAYMSPEQAALSSIDVDTRTDIYSLGVLLYELLTSTTPFDAHELLHAGLDEIRRVILNQNPIRPSTRLNTMLAVDLTTVAQHRQAEGNKLIRSVRGDLDWIVMMALEKDRTRRYQTVMGLARDVERYLADEAVTARSPSGWYKFQKLAARNRLLFAGLAAIALLLVASSGVLSVLLTREQLAHRDAEGARAYARADQQKAETEAAKSQQVTRFLEEMLQGVGPSVARGRDTAMLREILERTSERVGRDLNNQPAVQVELWTTIGNIWSQLRQNGKAAPLYRRALEQLRHLKGNKNLEVAALLLRLSGVLTAPVESELLDREAIAVYREHYGDESIEVAYAQNSLACHLSNLDEAEAMHRKVLALRRKLLGNENEHVAQSLSNLATVIRGQDRWAERETLNREVLTLWRKLLGNESLTVAKALGNLGSSLQAQGGFSEAEVAQREGLEILRKNLDEWHPDVTVTICNLIYVLARQNKQEEVTPLLVRLRQTDFTRYPEGLDQLNLRASALAQRGLWRDAATDAALFLQARPTDHLAYHTLAPLLVIQNDFNSYRKLCQTISERFGGTDDMLVADRMAKDCLILSIPDLDLSPISKLADLAVTKGSNHPALPLFRVCKATAEYRQGHFASAIDWADKTLQSSFPHARAEAYAVKAMASKRLEHIDDARIALANAEAVVNMNFPKASSSNIGVDWRDWIIAQRLVGEAKALIETAAATIIDGSKP